MKYALLYRLRLYHLMFCQIFFRVSTGGRNEVLVEEGYIPGPAHRLGLTPPLSAGVAPAGWE